jgi:YVTN family beta-propeller protein
MPGLPSGAVTFLFTDIEGSTQLVRQLRARYGEVLAEHQRLLREAFAAHGGHEIDTQGDAFFYAFASAHEAVLGAIAGQRALSAHAWPADAPVRVRMGIHTGLATPNNGRYTGLAVHRTARICAAAHGGQVLVSQATQSLLEDEEEELALQLKDLGEQRLKDIERPVRLYQVVAEGLPADFPPPRGDEEEAAEVVAPRPFYRRRLALAAGPALLAVLAGVLALLFAGGSGGLSEVSPNHLGIIDVGTNEIVGAIEVDESPGPLAVGANALWVLNLDSHTISRINVRARKLAYTGGIGGTPGNLVATQDDVWVSEGCSIGGNPGALVQIDTRLTGSVDVDQDIRLAGLGPAPTTLPTSPGCGLAASARAVWIATSVPAGLVRVDVEPGSETLSVGKVVRLPRAPTAVAIGADSVWAADYSENLVREVDPDTGEIVREIETGKGPVAIAVGKEDLWVVNRGDGSVSRVDLRTRAVRKAISVGENPVAITVADRFVWVANSGDGSLSRIDPETNQVTATVSVGNRPQGVAVAGGAVWVTVRR